MNAFATAARVTNAVATTRILRLCPLDASTFVRPVASRRRTLRQLPRNGVRGATARRERIDPSDEAFVTCTSCGSDELLSASKIVRQGAAKVTCSQCRATWTALANDALTAMGTKLIVPDGTAAEGEDEKEALKKLGVKLYVSGLGPKVNSAALKAALEEFGEVRDATVVFDKVTGRSRGFGFVTMVGKSAAAAAMDVLSGDSSTPLGRRLKVREAIE